MEAYKQEKSMNDDLRKRLVESVLQYCIANSHDLSVADCASLSKQISKAFPGELAVYYLFFFSFSHILSCLFHNLVYLNKINYY